MFRILFIFVISAVLFNLILSVTSSILAKKIKKKHPSLHIIGYKNGILWVGKRSDSKVCPIGLVPVAKCLCFDYEALSRPGVITDYTIKANFNLFKFPDVPYTLKIHKIGYFK